MDDKYGLPAVDKWKKFNDKLEANRCSTDVKTLKHNQSLEDLISFGLEEEMAKRILGLIVNAKIRNLHYQY